MNVTSAFSTVGTVRVANHDTAIPFHSRAFFDTGNTDALTISTTEEVIELADARDPSGGVDRSTRRIKSVSGSMNLRHMSKEAFVIALWGKASDIAATAITGEAHVLRADRFVPSNHLIDMTKTVTVKKGSTTILAADYLVESGGILFNKTLTTGSIADGDAITFDYTPLASYDIDALVTSAPLISVICNGENTINGKKSVDKLWMCRVGAVREFSRIGNGQFGSLQIDFTVERDESISGTDKSKYYLHTEEA